MNHEHEWFFYERLKCECCRNCGIIRRLDGKNKPCRGVTGVVPRTDKLTTGKSNIVERLKQMYRLNIAWSDSDVLLEAIDEIEALEQALKEEMANNERLK